jgi:hypothetical protein
MSVNCGGVVKLDVGVLRLQQQADFGAPQNHPIDVLFAQAIDDGEIDFA